MQRTTKLKLLSQSFLVCAGFLAAAPTYAETREERQERRRQEVREKQLADRERAQQQRELNDNRREALAAKQREALAQKSAGIEARKTERAQQRSADHEASQAAAAATPLPRTAAPRSASPPAPVAASRIPGQPTDDELRAVMQKRIDTIQNNDTRAMVDRCNQDRPKDLEERQYCEGWFGMEQIRTGKRGTMRYDDVIVEALTIRGCIVEKADYTCTFSLRFNNKLLLAPPLDSAIVRKAGTGWLLVNSNY